MVMVTFVLLTYLAGAPPRKMSGWDCPRRQTETGKTPSLLTTTRYSKLPIFWGVLLVMGSITLFIGGKTRMNFKTAPPSKFDLWVRKTTSAPQSGPSSSFQHEIRKEKTKRRRGEIKQREEL